MGRATKVPITPAMLRWAVAESGFAIEDVASAADVPTRVLQAWLAGRDRPSLTQARAVAAKLRRPLAAFLLPRVPKADAAEVQFRHPAGSDRRELNPEERNALRDAVRLQRVVGWALREAGAPAVSLPRHRVSGNAETAGASVRRLLGLDHTSSGWRSPTEALAGWRTSLEEVGVLVFLLPLGSASCRGFSVWDDHAPLIVANTWFNSQARVFTLLHELGHLVTRTSSACLDPPTPQVRGGDATERWCEEFAAAILLPRSLVEQELAERTGWRTGDRVTDLRTVSKIARSLNVSLRATALRLIKTGIANPGLYSAIPPTVDHKRGGGGGGDGRRRHEARRDQLGRRTVRIFLEAVSSGVLTTSDALEYLRVGYEDLGRLTGATREAGEAV
ncbi:MAG TPA: XRE family transcriptional regulator [Longimicrobiales bacterium]|nr:XRE family transcriptional regulator [Longimicrobiales bacterium]